MIRLLIVEDEAGIRETLADWFGDQGHQTTAAANLSQARAALTHLNPTIVLLDLALPDGDGLDFLATLRSRPVPPAVIILTARGEEAHRVRGLQAGADDYVVKPFGMAELAARVDAVLRRTQADSGPLRVGDLRLDLGAYRLIDAGGRAQALTQKEAELLAFFIENPGRVFRREELLRSVWGYEAFPSTRTVDTHVYALRRRIEAAPEAPRHLLTQRGVGYRFVP